MEDKEKKWDDLTTNEKVGKAVRLIRSVANQHNCFLAFSSGKDSCVLEFLVKEAGAKVRMVHNVTTIDPEGTLPFAVKHQC